ncbi:methyltransferase family protein [Spirosoma litoris]
MIYVFILLSWVIFGFIHSLTASLWVKQLIALKFSKINAYYRLLYNGIALITFLPVLWLHRMAPVDYVSSWQGSSLIGMLVIGVGFVVAVIALRGYDLAEFIGCPMTNSQTSQQELRQHGLLRYVRHPLYTGIILTLIGIWITQPTWSYLILLLVATLYIRIGIYFEERKLIVTFGNTYQQYRQRVPMLIPRLSQG